MSTQEEPAQQQQQHTSGKLEQSGGGGGGGVAANSSSSFPSSSASKGSTVAAVVAAAANTNKFSIVNINSQFKGKSIEPQAKTTVVRVSHGGMQTLGKAVAARRMPPPTNLPSLAKSTGISPAAATTTSSGNINSSSSTIQSDASSSASLAHNLAHSSSAAAAAASGNSYISTTTTTSVSGNSGSVGGSWPTPSQQNNVDSSSPLSLGISNETHSGNGSSYYPNAAGSSQQRGGGGMHESSYGESLSNQHYQQHQHYSHKWNSGPIGGAHLKQEVSHAFENCTIPLI